MGLSVVCLCVLYVHLMCVRIPHTKPTYMHTYVDMSEANCKLDLQAVHYLPACLSVYDMVEELLSNLLRMTTDSYCILLAPFSFFSLLFCFLLSHFCPTLALRAHAMECMGTMVHPAPCAFTPHFPKLPASCYHTRVSAAASLISLHLHACAGAYTRANSILVPPIFIPKEAMTYVLLLMLCDGVGLPPSK